MLTHATKSYTGYQTSKAKKINICVYGHMLKNIRIG